MRTRIGIIGVLVFLVALVMIWGQGGEEHPFLPPPPVDNQKIEQFYLQSSRSAVGMEDDPEARMNYMSRMLVDPGTGNIPRGIKKREHLFAQKIPHVNNGVRRKEDARALAAGTWISVGPDNIGGRTRALAIDVLDEDIILAGGVSGGMWRSADGGVSWEKTTNPMSLHSVTALTQDIRPGKENTWYYGTGEIVGNSAGRNGAPYRGDGIFKSVDGGKSWSQVLTTVTDSPNFFNSQFQYIFKILVDRYNLVTDELYVAAVGAVFRTYNGGLSWKTVLGRDFRSFPFYNLNESNLSRYTNINLAANGIYYAVMSSTGFKQNSPDGGVYASTDGVDWQNITPKGWPSFFSRTVIETSSSNPAVVYFLTDAEIPRLYRFDFKGVIKGQIRGDWVNLTDNLPAFGGEVGNLNTQGSYDMVLETHPSDEKVVFLGGTNLYRSEDGFSTNKNIQWIGGYDTANDISKYPNHFVDQHALVFYPTEPDRMLSSNDGGLYITLNNQAEKVSWRTLNNGYRTGQFYTLSVDEYGGAKHVMGGLMDNGVYVAIDPVRHAAWSHLADGDGAFGSITRNGSYFYTSTQKGRVLRFTLDNQLEYTTFTRVDPLGGGATEPGYLFINPFILAPENQNVMYLAAGDKIWRNMNLSQIPSYSNAKARINWESMEDTHIDRGQISALVASTVPAGRVYYGTTTGHLYRIDDAREPGYTVVPLSSPFFPINAYISCLAVDKRNSDVVLVAFSNYNILSLFISIDGGMQFVSVGGNLEENRDGSGDGPSVRWVEIIPRKGGAQKYFAGTSTGLFSTDQLKGSTTLWEREGSEEIGNVVVTMMKARPSDGALYVATHGNGVYKTAIPDMENIVPEPDDGGLSIGPVYPNPFSDKVKISFTVPEDGMVRIRIYTANAQLIRTLIWGTQFAGKNVVIWDGLNESGYPVNTGMYICQMEYSDKRLSKKILYYN